MKVKFKYNIGDTVKLINLPTYENMQYGRYLLKSEFTPKEYKIEKCKCSFRGDKEPKLLYNLYAYCDEYIQFHNWIPEDNLEGIPNEHEEEIEFISHDKEVLSIGDVVVADAFYGDYEKPYMSPDLTFTYIGTIVGLEYEMHHGLTVRTAIVENDRNFKTEFTPYIVKNINDDFLREYVQFCKIKRFNPIKEGERSYPHHKIFLEGINLWDKMVEMYNNWEKIRTKEIKKNSTKKKTKSDTVKADIKKLLKSLSETEKEELRKQLNK